MIAKFNKGLAPSFNVARVGFADFNQWEIELPLIENVPRRLRGGGHLALSYKTDHTEGNPQCGLNAVDFIVCGTVLLIA